MDHYRSPKRTAFERSPASYVILFLFVFTVSFLVYKTTLGSDFIWDDEYLIINNSQIKSFSHFFDVFKTYVGYGSENINNFYRPLQEISNMIDFSVWGLNPAGFHLTNVILHSLVSVCVMLIMLLLTHNRTASFIGALLYAVHPVHTEAVSYIAGRADPLYTLFFLLSLSFFIISVSPYSGVHNEKKGPRVTLRVLSLLFFVLSILSKEMGIILPVFIYLYVLFYFKGTENDLLYKQHRFAWIPYAALAAIYGILRHTILDFSDIAPGSLFSNISLPYRFITFLRTIAVYFRLMLFPVDLHMERSITMTTGILRPESLTAILMGIGIFYFIIKTYRMGKRTVSFAACWFLAALLPVSNILPINSVIAEHWLYLASIGPFMLAGLFAFKLWQIIPDEKKYLKIIYPLFIICVLLSYSSMTNLRNKDWHNELNFFKSTLKYHPDNVRLHLNLGNTYFEKGHIDKAIEQYQRCIELNPDYAIAYGNTGSAYLKKGDIQNAEKYLVKAVELKPDFAICHFNLALVYSKTDMPKKAKEECITATKQLPQFYPAWNLLGNIYRREGDINNAIQAFHRSLEILPRQNDIRQHLQKLKRP